MANPTTLTPPAGFSTWLDYAVATMDTRAAQLESIFAETDVDPPSRDEMRAAAQAELDALRAIKHDLPAQFVIDIKQGLMEAERGDVTEYKPG